MGLAWEEAEAEALDKQRVASQCVPIRSHGRGMNQGQGLFILRMNGTRFRLASTFPHSARFNCSFFQDV